MNRTQRIAIWVATLVITLALWKVFGQGFGSFSHDQPFLARNYPPATPCVQGDVTNIAGLTYWFIPDSNAFYDTSFSIAATNGGRVKGWKDLSGNANDVVNHFNSGSGDDNKAPTLLTNFINGLSVVEFTNGSLDHVRSGTMPITVFVVYKSKPVFSGYFFGSTTSDSSLLAMATFIGSPTDSSKRLGGFFPAAATNDFVVFSAVLNGATSKAYTNGVVCDAGGGVDVTGLVSDGLRLGDNSIGNANPDQPGKFYLAEFIYYEAALSDVNRQKIECYLSTKYAP